MQSTRRRFLVLAGSAFAASAAFFSDLLRSLRPAAAQSTWSLRRATYDDLADLRDIFNQQRGAGLFPFTELIEPWSDLVGHAQVVRLDDDGLTGASDPRADGAALGC